MNQTVLLVGATGMFGSRVAHYLLEQPNTHLRLLVRDPKNSAKQNELKPFLDRGAEIVVGDLAEHDALDQATQGVAVIVSAVQGGPDVIIDGQVALAEAGKRNGVRRILPSDYALDLFKSTPGEHMMFDLRRTADEKIAEVGLEQVNILQGAFMNLFLPGMGAINLDEGTVTFWGDGTQPIEATTVEDTARMAARVALDPGVASGKFAFTGDRISFQGAADVIEAQTGVTLERRSLGSEADLRAALAKAQQDTSNPYGAVMLAYLLYMLTGQTALSDLQNERYPDLKLESFREFAERSLLHQAAA